MTFQVSSDCIIDTLHSIVKYQNKYQEMDSCYPHCAEQLLDHEKEVQKNTIPFILYTKDGCPFRADGFTMFHCHCCDEEKLKCVSSFIFRVKKIEGDCAILELLTFNTKDDCSDATEKPSSPCHQIDYQKVKDLIRTNIFIKIKPSCFCSISCLPALFIRLRKK